MDDSEFTRCLQRLQSSISANDCQYDNFDVSEIQHGISALKFGRSAGIDCLTKEHIVYAVVCRMSVYAVVCLCCSMSVYV